jgi:hypothetical protein
MQTIFTLCTYISLSLGHEISSARYAASVRVDVFAMTNSSVLAHPLCDKLWCVVTMVSGIMLRRRREQPYFSRVPSLEHNAKRHQLDTGTVGTAAHGAANGRHRQPPVLVLSSSFVESRTRLSLIA